MNEILSIVILVINALAYIIFNIYRFKKMHKDKLSYKITFILKRILIILFLTLITIFSFQEYNMFYSKKMITIAIWLFFILAVEAFILASYLFKNGCYESKYDLIVMTFVLVICMLLMSITISPTSITYKEDKVEVKKHQLITSSDEVLINGKEILLFNISKYVENDNLMYKYYYLSEDNNELLTATCPDKDTEIVFIEEGQESYVEITTITKQYMFNELKEPKVYEHICSELGHDENNCEYAQKITYKLYAPRSAFEESE